MVKCFTAVPLIMLCASVAAVHSQSTERTPLAKIMADVASPKNYTETAISPDATWVAWAQSTPPKGKAASIGSAIYLASAAHPDKVLQVTAAPSGTVSAGSLLEEKALAWAPDGTSLAFLSDAELPGQRQLYVMRLTDHAIRQLTHLKGFLATPRWSPDGKTIAFLFTENAARAAGPLEAVPQETGVIGQQILEQRIATVALDTPAWLSRPHY